MNGFLNKNLLPKLQKNDLAFREGFSIKYLLKSQENPQITSRKKSKNPVMTFFVFE
jgi:hypothetical protein